MKQYFRSRILAATAFTLLAGMSAASAEVRVKSKKLDVTADIGVGFQGDNLSKLRLTVKPQAKVGLKKGVDLNVAARVELADDETGLGDTSSFSDLSAPFLDEREAKLHLDAFNVVIRKSRTRLILGKQIVAWGALDGIRVTDVVSPADLRESVATEHRPERLPIWAARIQTKIKGTSFDFIFSPDPTTNQVAEHGDLFSRKAPRFIGGFQASDTAGVTIERESRNSYLKDAVYAVRVGKNIGEIESHLSVVSGPVQDPIFAIEQNQQTGPTILLTHPRRTLVGVDFVRPIGSFVARFEAAYLNNHPFNELTPAGPVPIREDRVQVGGGFDWSAPGGIFVNAQLFADHVFNEQTALTRPSTDLVSTFRASHTFNNDKIEFRTEWLNSYTDGDGLLRFDLYRTLGERYRIGLGTDIFYGSDDGIFGQFSDRSRLRFQVKATY